jgi:hypothetical protein
MSESAPASISQVTTCPPPLQVSARVAVIVAASASLLVPQAARTVDRNFSTSRLR